MIRPDRAETTVQVLILLLIAATAGAASFTHVHDWTMRNSPAGTGTWFGWANAVISELTPTAAGIEIRRRKRQDRPVGYPMGVLIAAATVSLTAQVAEARHTLAGWLVATLPALAFLALTKLVLSRTTTKNGQPSCVTATTPNATSAPAAGNPAPTLTAAPAAATPAPDTQDETPHGELLMPARMAAFTHHQATGQPITADALAEHLGIPPGLAGTLLTHIDGTPPSVTAVNGTGTTGSRP